MHEQRGQVPVAKELQADRDTLPDAPALVRGEGSRAGRDGRVVGPPPERGCGAHYEVLVARVQERIDRGLRGELRHGVDEREVRARAGQP
ncbi:hypothetical protein [Flavimobilis soli]|uniref:hypothetical protein n=1 Tax=Flavimobilis soli TaxID=442709 RepID=UPI001CA4DE13|nr:hypothetical protein [Flavimobilis soli]